MGLLGQLPESLPRHVHVYLCPMAFALVDSRAMPVPTFSPLSSLTKAHASHPHSVYGLGPAPADRRQNPDAAVSAHSHTRVLGRSVLPSPNRHFHASSIHSLLLLLGRTNVRFVPSLGGARPSRDPRIRQREVDAIAQKLLSGTRISPGCHTINRR